MRLRQLRIAFREPLHQAQVGGGVGAAAEQPPHLHEAVDRRVGVAREQLGEIGLGLIDALGCDQQHDRGLQRLQRGRVGVLPGACRVQREFRHARKIGELHGAARHARIARALGEVEVSLCREARAAALLGDFA